MDRHYTEPLLDRSDRNHSETAQTNTAEYRSCEQGTIESMRDRGNPPEWWPKAACKQAVLFQEEDTEGSDPCTLGYTGRYLYLEQSPEHHSRIVDFFDPADIIGAELEVQFDGHGWAEELAQRFVEECEDSVSELGGSRRSIRLSMHDDVGIRNVKAQSKRHLEQLGEDRRDSVNATALRRQKFQVPMKESGSTSSFNLATETVPSPFPIACGEDDSIPNMSVDLNELFKVRDLDPIGAPNMEGGHRVMTNQATAFLNIYSYPRTPPQGLFSRCNPCSNPRKQLQPRKDMDPEKMGHRVPSHRRWEVGKCEDFAQARSIVRAIRRAAKLGHISLDQESSRPPRYLVIVNPFSGTKQGKSIYKSTVQPMLDQCGVDHDLCITQHAGHAQDRMSIHSTNTSSSGHDDPNVTPHPDADLSEYDAVIAMGGDGVLWEILQGIQERPDATAIMKRLKFGIIGCGTSNGLAKSILHASREKYSAVESTFVVCKGQISALDLAHYDTTPGISHTGFLTFSWGFISDVDLESEVIRCLGVLRNDVWGVWRVLNLRTYKAKFSYLPPSSSSTPIDVLPPLSEPLPSDWVTIDDDFILFWACQVTHAAHNLHNSPLSELQDGLFQVMVVRASCPRLRLAQLLLTMDSGDHVSSDYVEFFECVAFRLEPETSKSSNNLDGERIEDGPIQARIMPGAIQFFTGELGGETKLT